MNIQDLKGLTPQGIERHLMYLETIVTRAEHYHAFSNMIEGQFLLADLMTHRDQVRDLYKMINLDNEHAAVMLLAKLQATEDVLNGLIAKLTSHAKVAADAAREIKDIRGYFAECSKESSANVRTQFVPTDHSQPEEKDHGRTDGGAVDGEGGGAGTK
jgi:hypothetical protein